MPIVQVSYYIGKHGPFTDEYPKEGATPQAIQAGIRATCDMLRAIGAIPMDATY